MTPRGLFGGPSQPEGSDYACSPGDDGHQFAPGTRRKLAAFRSACCCASRCSGPAQPRNTGAGLVIHSRHQVQAFEH